MAQLKGKVAIVTGASKGIGAAIAEDLAKSGASVIVNYAKSAKSAEAVVAKIEAAGGTAKAVQADVSKPAEAKRLIDDTVKHFGKVDILINNAGVYEFRALGEVTEEHFDSIFDLDVKGLLFATQAAVNAFGDNGGSIINIGSVASQMPMATGSVYSAAKAAVDSLTRTYAVELGPKKIRVNAVLPGPVETEGTKDMPEFEYISSTFVPRTALGRIGQPVDIARVVTFLVSPESGWVTGQIIAASGGLY